MNERIYSLLHVCILFKIFLHEIRNCLHGFLYSKSRTQKVSKEQRVQFHAMGIESSDIQLVELGIIRTQLDKK